MLVQRNHGTVFIAQQLVLFKTITPSTDFKRCTSKHKSQVQHNNNDNDDACDNLSKHGDPNIEDCNIYYVCEVNSY